MSVTTHKGHAPKIRPYPTHEILQGLLVELEAAADLVEQLLVNGPDSSVVAALVQSLDEMGDLLKGGRHE